MFFHTHLYVHKHKYLPDFLVKFQRNLEYLLVKIRFCLFVFPIITQEPLDQFASNFDRKKAKIVIYDHVRENGGKQDIYKIAVF